MNVSQSRYKIVKSREEIHELISYVKTTGYCAFDFETKAKGPLGNAGPGSKKPMGFQYKEDEPTVIGVSFQPGSTWVIPLFHFDSPFKRSEVHIILKQLSKELFENPKIVKIAHNMKFEHKWLLRYGCDLRGRLNDTMLMHYLIDENERHGLKEIVSMYFPDYEDYEQEIRELVVKHKGWEFVPLEPLSKYNGLDCDLTLRVFHLLEPELVAEGLYSVYRNLLMMSHRVLTESEFEGILVDKKYLNSIIEETDKKIKDNDKKLRSHKFIRRFNKWRKKNHIKKLVEDVKQEIEDIKNNSEKTREQKQRLIKTRQEKLSRYVVGDLQTKKEQFHEVNFNSPKQIADLLYFSPGGFKFPVIERTESGAPSTAEAVLLVFRKKDKSGFIDQLLKQRELTKLFSTYMVAIRDRITEKSRIHGSFLIHGTVTGRLSSKSPNLQNIPRDTTSSLIKKMYVCPPGYLMLQLDYSQAELRVMAEMANETSMLSWFNEGRDVHLSTACKKYNYNYDKAKTILSDDSHPDYTLWKKRRKQAKTINFGIIYEEGPNKLAEGLSTEDEVVGYDEAKEFLEDYFETFPRVKTFINRQHRKVSKQGFVTNLFGRKRRLPDIYSEDQGLFLRAQRQSTNTPVQGSASDFALFSSILIREAKMRGELPWDMPQIFTVHDSLGFYIRPNDIHKSVPILERICENPETKKWFSFRMKKVRMKVDFEIGINWGELKEYNPDIDYIKFYDNVTKKASH